MTRSVHFRAVMVTSLWMANFVLTIRQTRLANYSRANKDERRKLRPQFEKAPPEWGLDYEAFCNDDPKAVDRWNLSQWRLYADYMREYWLQRKPYWIGLECTCDDGRGVGGLLQPIPLCPNKNDIGESKMLTLLKALRTILQTRRHHSLAGWFSYSEA